MEMSKTTIGVLAILCISAGAGWAYMATRGDQPAPASANAEAVAEAAAVTPSSSVAAVAEPEPTPQQFPVTDDTPRPVAPPLPSSRPSPPPEPRAAAAQPAALPEAEADIAGVFSDLAPELDAPPAPEVTLGAQSLARPVVTPVRPPAPVALGAVETASPEFEEFVLSTDSGVGLQVETLTTSENARIEDEVVARVTRDVRVRERVVIPAGAEARGEVTLVDRGGQLRDRARLGVRFTLLVLADGTRIPLETDMLYREGDTRGGQSASRIGGGVIGGAIIGGIFGGTRGAAIGGSIGAGAGTAAAVAASRDPAVLPRGAAITVRITAPTTVILPKE